MTGYTLFDRFVAHRRYNAAFPHLKKGASVCDLGCGPGAPFLEYAKDRISRGVGVDDVGRETETGHRTILTADITRHLPLADSEFDHVTMLAVLEHLPVPESVLREAFRLLRPGGSLILTWPHQAVDPILNFLSRLGMVANEMGLDEHQKRIPLADLKAMLKNVGFTEFRHRRFELGLNNLLVATKPIGEDLLDVDGAVTLSAQTSSDVRDVER